MKLLKLIFGKKRKRKSAVPTSQPRAKSHSPGYSINNGLLSISAIDFFGDCNVSPSGDWILGWSDRDTTSGVSGSRDSGHGRYILFNKTESRIEYQGKLERPNSGHVADNGNFSIEDWHFNSGLSGTFYVFSKSGFVLIEKSFSANLYDNAISKNGLLAICQTANSPTGDEGNLLVGFNIKDGRELFSTHPSTGWATSYKFDEDRNRFGSVFKDLGTFYRDSNGELLDPGAFEKAKLSSGSYVYAIRASEEIVKSDESNRELIQEALDASTKALTNGADNNDHWKSLAFKVIGLAHERLNNLEQALEAFDAALDINPKIGVKRKATSIRKKLSA